MFSIDTTSNENYYIILMNGVEFVKVKKTNDLEVVKKQFGIKEVK